MARNSRVISFPTLAWTADVPGIRERAMLVDGQRWAIVEYAVGAQREEWCPVGHTGFVIAGEIEYEFADGGDTLRARSGDGFLLLKDRPHRGRNCAQQATLLFLIDDPET
jgi:hypothetical protein